MSSQSATSAYIASITVPPQYLRSLDQFENQKELLYALSDAIAQNEREWMTSGVVHGNINLDTIRIGNMYGPPGTRGILVDNQQSPTRSATFAFKSLMSIVKGISTSKRIITLDYVDDLESFFYVLAYICTTFSGPHTRLPTSAIPYQTKLMWSITQDGFLSSRFSQTSFLEKDTDLKFFRYNKPGGCRLTPYFSGYRIMEALLEDLHCVLRYRYLRKVGGEGIDPRPAGMDSEELRALMREEASDDYFRFKQCVEYAVNHLGGDVC